MKKQNLIIVVAALFAATAPFAAADNADKRGEWNKNRAELREKFNNLSEEERAELREKFAARRAEMRAKFENLSEEERAELREKMKNKRKHSRKGNRRGR